MKNFFPLVMLLILFIPQVVNAENPIFATLVYSRYQVSQSWDKSGQLADNVGLNGYDGHGDAVYTLHPFLKDEIAFYMHFFPTDNLKITVFIPYDEVRSGINRSQGFTDVEFGAIYTLKQIWSRQNLNLKASIGIPAAYDIAHAPFLGYGVWFFYGGVEIPLGVYPFTWELYGGWKDFWGYAADQLNGGVRFLYSFWYPCSLVGSVNITKGLLNENKTDPGYLITKAESYNIVTVDLAVKIDVTRHISCLLGYYEDIWGRNTGHGKGIKSAFWYTF